ncbi:hypothetical protein AB656_05810 [Bifidobacterium actinocoloniiforme DSM 22766]|nr:hypothetical protein AB656_05810 [Bifidobacterium actinocoloniiforme DSM 22766]
MRPTPTTHRSAAKKLRQAGRLRVAAQTRKGTSTQYVAVRKELRPGPMVRKPSICSRKADQ